MSGFDADGFLTRRGGDIFQYSATGELLKATLADGMVIEYTYDGLGRRVARIVNGQTWQYLYGNPGNPVQITATREPDGTLTGYYYDGDGRLFSFERNGVRYYAACDQVGTPKVVTDTAGNTVKQLSYDSFGCLTNDSNPTFFLPVGFAGGLADPDTGLIRFGFRDYDPEAGRWTAKDPIFFNGGQFNLYGYCGSDPIDYVDEDGLFVPLLAGAIFGGEELFGLGLALLGAGLLLAKRSQNKLKPDPKATGAHLTCKRDSKTGKVTNYAEWGPNPQNPSGFQEEKRYDGVGRAHNNLLPHVHDNSAPGGVRTPNPWEIPK